MYKLKFTIVFIIVPNRFDIECLLDEYMLFLYQGYVKQLKILRKALCMTQRQFADMVVFLLVQLSSGNKRDCYNVCELYKSTKVNSRYRKPGPLVKSRLI